MCLQKKDEKLLINCDYNSIIMEYQEITKISKKHNKSIQRVANDHDKEIPKEIYVSPEERQKVIDELRLK